MYTKLGIQTFTYCY